MILTSTPARDEAGRDEHGMYLCEDGVERRSVTTYQRGNDALLYWAAACERKGMLAAAQELDPGFAAKLEAALPKPKYWVKERDDAGDFGTRVHKAVAWMLASSAGQPHDDPNETDPVIVESALAAVGYLRDHRAKIVHVEKRVWSAVGNFAGTLDGYFEMNTPEAFVDVSPGRIHVVCDWKTGSDVRPDAVAQLGAYGMGLVERGLHDSDIPLWGLIGHIPKRNKTKVLKAYIIQPLDLKDAGRAFLDCVRKFESDQLMEKILDAAKAAYKAGKKEEAA